MRNWYKFLLRRGCRMIIPTRTDAYRGLRCGGRINRTGELCAFPRLSEDRSIEIELIDTDLLPYHNAARGRLGCLGKHCGDVVLGYRAIRVERGAQFRIWTIWNKDLFDLVQGGPAPCDGYILSNDGILTGKKVVRQIFLPRDAFEEHFIIGEHHGYLHVLQSSISGCEDEE